MVVMPDADIAQAVDALIGSAYGSAGTVFGGMGVVGPTRMDYPGTMANVAAVAMYIGEVLGNRAG